MIWTAITGTMTTALCALGDQLGLYRALATTGAVTSSELAIQTGLHERWLREWLYHQACAGVVSYVGNSQFLLTPEAAEVLTNEQSLLFAGGGLATIMALARVTPRIEQCFRTGLGLPYDAFGVDCAVGLERMGGAWLRQKFVSELLPMMSGVVDKLTRGATVADIGCGTGTTLLLLAQAFPQSLFHESFG